MRTNTIGAKYLVVGVILAAFVAVLVAVVRTTPASAHIVQGAALIQPVVALVVLTAIVGVMMVVYRNVALIRGAATARYFQTFTADQPAEWVERPTRTYMNLLELPVRHRQMVVIDVFFSLEDQFRNCCSCCAALFSAHPVNTGSFAARAALIKAASSVASGNLRRRASSK